MSTFTISSGYSWVDGELSTATKLNLAASPTISGSQSFSFASGSATAASINFSADSTSGFYLYAGGQTGYTSSGSAKMIFGSYLTEMNGDNATGAGAIPQEALGYNGTAQYQHFVQTRHNGAAGGTGNAWVLWLNTSATATASTAPGTSNARAVDFSADQLKFYSNNGTLGLTLDSGSSLITGTAALATTTSAGFIYVPSCNGVPTGTPTAYTGRVALVYNTNNDTLYGYNNNVWHAL